MNLNQSDYASAHPTDRSTEAKNRRIAAAELTASRSQAIQENNREEELDGLPASFS